MAFAGSVNMQLRCIVVCLQRLGNDMKRFNGVFSSLGSSSVRRGVWAALWVAGMGTSMVLAQGVASENAKVARAKADLMTFASCMKQFRLDCDRYPSNSEGLKALMMEPAKLNSWRGPYLRPPAKCMDPWGHPYLYKTWTKKGHEVFQVVSYGADGKPGGVGVNADLVEGLK